MQREFSYDSGYSSSCPEHASETSHSPRDSRYECRGSSSRQLGLEHRAVQSRPVSPQPSTESYPSDSYKTLQFDFRKLDTATADCSSQGSNMHVSGHDSSCFHYGKLRAKEIRLLQLEPQTTTMIKYKPLFYTTIDNAPPYVAISYAWGDVHNQKGIPVQVGAHPLKITESLHGALKALVQQVEVFVWADGVCINQQDPDERSRQVRLMPLIYGQAESVFVWLGPEGEDSHLAMQLIEHIARNQDCLERLKDKLRSPNRRKDVSALVCLFERDYWQRLWVAQEVFNAKRVTVLCGNKGLPWEMFRAVGAVFKKYETELWSFFRGSWGGHDRSLISKNRVPYFHVLTHDGPSSFPDKADVEMLRRLGDRTFLDVLCAGRQKLTVDPRDKVYAILGLLPREIRDDFIPNYKVSIADVYINVFDYLLTTTHRLDVICEAIHYPLHLSTLKLPTWVPDWSYIPHCEHLPRKGIYRYRADRGESAVFRFLDEQGNAIEHSGPIIEIQGIELGKIRRRGVAVDVLHSIDDYLMAFLHWRALLRHYCCDNNDTELVREKFCRSLCLGRIPRKYDLATWATIFYHSFASLLRNRLPYLVLDAELQRYADADSDMGLEDWNKVLDEACHFPLAGRAFCVTDNGLMGVGSAFMTTGDVVIVPFGCHTPIILRREGKDQYRYVGEVYVDGYMNGEAVDELDAGNRSLSKFVLH
jgi:hypothetical protein